MNDKKKGYSTVGTGGMTFGSTLALIFIVLKLCHIINWSWIWVLSPIWISWAIFIVLIIVLFIIAKINEVI